MFMGNFVETGGILKKLKHVSALACIFGRRVSYCGIHCAIYPLDKDKVFKLVMKYATLIRILLKYKIIIFIQNVPYLTFLGASIFNVQGDGDSFSNTSTSSSGFSFILIKFNLENRKYRQFFKASISSTLILFEGYSPDQGYVLPFSTSSCSL